MCDFIYQCEKLLLVKAEWRKGIIITTINQ